MVAGFSPLDDRLALLPGQYSPWVVEAVTRLGAWMPFERVPEALAFFTGVVISREAARRLTETAGACLEAVEAAEVDHLIATWPPPPAGPPTQLLSIDGAMVPLVGGRWTEVKLLAVGTVTPQPDAAGGLQPHTTDLSYVARVADADHFTRHLTGETHRRGTATAGQVAAVMDGAVWLQGVVDVHRPDAVRILDFPHAVEHLSLPATLVFGTDSPALTRWRDQVVHQLRHGDPADVLEAVATLPATTTAAHDAIRSALDYLCARWEQIQYATFTAQGLPVGSGSVEGGHKVVMQARLKGSGMHWAPANVNPLLALRCAACNDRWPERWTALTQRWRTTTAVRQAVRCAVRRAARPAVAATAACHPQDSAPEPQPVVLPVLPRIATFRDGRPTAAHPWKRGHRLPHSGAPSAKL